MITKEEWKVNKNMMGTYTIFTEDAHIADVDRHFNAQLIAAAPDLYEALKDILTHVIQEDKEFELTEALIALAKVEVKK